MDEAEAIAFADLKIDELLEERDELEAEIEHLKAERDRWKSAFEKYGQHNPECDFVISWSEKVCDCGYDAALKPYGPHGSGEEPK